MESHLPPATKRHEHTPSRTAAILNVRGEPCTGATAGDYPLLGFCACGETIICRDGTADWGAAQQADISLPQWARLTHRTTYYVHRTRDDRDGWTRVRGERQAFREVQAWSECGWATTIHPTSAEIRRQVAEWEKRAKGYPGEATR